MRNQLGTFDWPFFAVAKLIRLDQLSCDAVTPQDIVWEKEDKVKDKIQTCDQYNAPGRYMIYCQGKLLQAVMATQLHKDSKTFVDRPLKEGREGAKVLAEFEKLFPQNVSDIKVEDVRAFVDTNFDQEGHELKE
ncbi:hypothetical protein ANCCEY_14866 [Ancylostoma ceylanicum]|uniref:Trehalase n=1 Tax=Ancylostoma ceylanicum TaxID=53326 RepID=A0A0D6L5S5_9BILA|nr:hypothetical protein ANCCEY_14866 [Ancylostoma ceylanicum]